MRKIIHWFFTPFLAASALLLLAACGGGGSDLSNATIADGSVTRAATALNLANTGSLNSVSTGQVFAYQMTGAKGQTINASAMLFAPKGAAPAGGWPLLVFGHGTVGWAQTCSPTSVVRGASAWVYQDLVAGLVGQGRYAVVAPDYEGLGPAELGVVAGHPYLNLDSAGKSMVYSVVAAKSILGSQLSGKWAAIGHSQGGHAALAAAQYSDLAAKQNPSLVYKGAVAVAPASGLLSSLNALQQLILAKSQNPADYPAGYELVGTLTGYTALLVKGTQSTLASVANDTIFPDARDGLKTILASLNTKCADEVTTNLTGEIANYAQSPFARPSDYPGASAAAVSSASVTSILNANEPGQTKLPAKTLIVQGLLDTTVLPVITNQLVTTMQTNGSTVEYKTYAQGGHSTVLSASANDVVFYLSSLFAQ
jgi:pimeloyl-ACP methyl ester carboxylesterase